LIGTPPLIALKDFDGPAELITGTVNGVIKVWKDFVEETPELVTSWKALQDLPNRPGPGMVLDWQQQHGLLMASGDLGIIRVWDLERELAVQDIISGSESCVTSLAHQAGRGHLLIAGCGPITC